MNETPPIHKDMAVLDIVAQWTPTQDVFRRYDEKAGECIMCQALFETVETVAERYGLDLHQLLRDLNQAAQDNMGKGVG